MPVHFAANDRKKSFAVYDNPDAVLLYYFVEFRRLIDVFEVVGQSGAALVADPYADELWGRAAHEDSQAFNCDGSLCVVNTRRNSMMFVHSRD